MQLCNLKTDNGNFIGIKKDGAIRILDTENDELKGAGTVDQLLKLNIELNDLTGMLQDNLLPLKVEEENAKFGPVVNFPGKIVCIGLNYKSHASEVKDKQLEIPILFSKFSDTVLGHNGSIKVDEYAKNVDYEAELGILIGKHAYRIDKKDALNYAFGYFPANDVSARDLQFKTSQWLIGKTLPGYAPIGPYVTTRDEIENPNSLDISLTLNGELRQNSNTSNMTFQCDYLIWYISNYIPLEPGDIILTGTPEGIINGMPPEKRVWLKHGDITEVRIEKLGILRTNFV